MTAEQLRQKLETHAQGSQVTADYALEAEQNLTGFLALLIKINEREKLVALEPPQAAHEASHAR